MVLDAKITPLGKLFFEFHSPLAEVGPIYAILGTCQVCKGSMPWTAPLAPWEGQQAARFSHYLSLRYKGGLSGSE